MYFIFSKVNDAQSSTIPGSPPSSGEALSKRCVSLIRTALKPDLWPSEATYIVAVTYMYMYMLNSVILV